MKQAFSQYFKWYPIGTMWFMINYVLIAITVLTGINFGLVHIACLLLQINYSRNVHKTMGEEHNN